MAVAGLEKFSHLEDKIYRTVELCKTLKQEKEELEREVALVEREGRHAQGFERLTPAPVDCLITDFIRF